MILDNFDEEINTPITVIQVTTENSPITGKPIKNETTIFDGLCFFYQESPSVAFTSDTYKPTGKFTALLKPTDTVKTITRDMKAVIDGQEYNISDAWDIANQNEVFLLGLDYVS
jgi:hypothetical protein